MLQRARPCRPPTASHYHRIGFVCTVMGKGGQISSISLTGVLGVPTIRRPRRYGDENMTYCHLLNICTSVCHCDSQPYISMRRQETNMRTSLRGSNSHLSAGLAWATQLSHRSTLPHIDTSLSLDLVFLFVICDSPPFDPLQVCIAEELGDVIVRLVQ